MNGEASSQTRILFVDDSKVMVKTAAKILSAEFEVVTAVDGDDAWGKLEHDHDIQVLFTDINMPGTDGYGLLRKVRTADEPGLRGMPVILVTGADDHETAREKAMDSGATDFIDKRSLSLELLPRARAHAKYQRMTRQLQAQSTLDTLTGLANEAGFLGRLEQDIFYARRHGQDLAVMRVEIDGLVAAFQDRGEKVIEDVVMHVAELIRKRIRHEDTAGRIGLSGFAISAPGGRLEGIEAEAVDLQRLAGLHALEIDGQVFPISLRTAVISAEPNGWSSAHDALQACQAQLDSQRRRASAPPAPVPVEQPQPVTPRATPTPVVAMAPEPAVAKMAPTATEPAAAHAPKAKPTPVELPREQPKPVAAQESVRKTPNAPQRLLSNLQSMGARQWTRLVRFLKELFGR